MPALHAKDTTPLRAGPDLAGESGPGRGRRRNDAALPSGVPRPAWAAALAGVVAYGAVGSGPPLVLITGYGGTMEGWDRCFVDALAQHHRVVIFDNAGVGQTQALPAPLSIDAMANQTSARQPAVMI